MNKPRPIQWSGAMFWSYSARAWCGLFAHLWDGRAMCRHELTWFNVTPEQASRDLARFLRTHEIEPIYVVAQPEIFPKPKSYGETVSETFMREGIALWRGSSDRVSGWTRVRSWLEVVDGKPMLTIHESCKYLLRTLPTLVSDAKNPDDIEDSPDAYPARALAFWAMSRPSAKVDDDPELPEGAIGHLVRDLRREAAMSRR